MFTIDLFAALTKVGIPEEDAKNLVVSIDEYITMSVAQATKPVLDKLDNIQLALSAQVASAGTVQTAKIEALGTSVAAQLSALGAIRDRRTSAFRWAIGTAIAVVPTTILVLKALNLMH